MKKSYNALIFSLVGLLITGMEQPDPFEKKKKEEEQVITRTPLQEIEGSQAAFDKLVNELYQIRSTDELREYFVQNKDAITNLFINLVKSYARIGNFEGIQHTLTQIAAMNNFISQQFPLVRIPFLDKLTINVHDDVLLAIAIENRDSLLVELLLEHGSDVIGKFSLTTGPEYAGFVPISYAFSLVKKTEPLPKKIMEREIGVAKDRALRSQMVFDLLFWAAKNYLLSTYNRNLKKWRETYETMTNEQMRNTLSQIIDHYVLEKKRLEEGDKAAILATIMNSPMGIDSFTPFLYGLLSPNLEAVSAALALGATIHRIDNQGRTPLWILVSMYCSPETADEQKKLYLERIAFLLKHGANPNWEVGGKPLLHYVILCNDVKLLDTFLTYTKKLNLQKEFQESPDKYGLILPLFYAIQIALETGNTELINLFVSKESDLVNQPTSLGVFPLEYALYTGLNQQSKYISQILYFLINLGAEISNVSATLQKPIRNMIEKYQKEKKAL